MKGQELKDGFRRILEGNKSRAVLRKSYAFDSAEFSEARALNTSMESLVARDEEHSWQIQLRPRFGKQGVNRSKIGGHPDFDHLAGTDGVEFHHTCALFLDIKNSTRLTLLYKLEDVIWIKNSILKAASEIVRSLDGHVHRFMGDALLAFFGRKGEKMEDSVVNAINCVSVLESLMVNTIIPVLVDEGYDAKDLGFRIGLDFGEDGKVAWSSYGYNEVREVTATSFYVDVASKLQGMARKNNCMMGEGLLKSIDFPEAFVRKKKVVENGQPAEVDYLDRRYTDRDGNTLRYKVRELSKDGYRDLLPFGAELKAQFEGSSCVGHQGALFQCYVNPGNSPVEYYSASRSLPKGTALEFKLTLRGGAFGLHLFPLKVSFTKRNHGAEAQLSKSAGVFPVGDHSVLSESEVGRGQFFLGKTIKFPEYTLYRGLHTMEAMVNDRLGNVVFRDFIGVYID
ncbi:hypothetical protein VV867_17425 [Pseudomonas sp. JH-2]|uniref:nucleotide-binding domain-containing protein n=1 Tax=Pseudomonas sp. JH-2 TaxID=3114998 RepID=UPI002E2523D7|nr:hypothetical protein [Pseudomonas sp. JH-2]